EPLVADDEDLVFPDEVFKHLLGHVRLEDPHRPVRAVDGRRALPFVAEVLAPLPPPRGRRLIVLPDTVIEVARETANDRLVARVGESEAAARQPAEVTV